MSPELGRYEAAYFQSFIGVLWWIVKLGHAELTMETSDTASIMALTHKGHIKVIFQIFAFLKNKYNAVMVFHPTERDINESQLYNEDWSAIAHGECKEEIPPNAPRSPGIGFKMQAFVDSDHAGDSIIRRSRTGFLIFLNCAPIYWFSNKQTSIDTSSFDPDSVKIKQCFEYVRGLRYKLCMMGIPVKMLTFVFGDNKSVLSNTSMPRSTFKNVPSSISLHFFREEVAKYEW